jgi:uncharacterized protein YutE (UPF0331/DUF86 family)
MTSREQHLALLLQSSLDQFERSLAQLEIAYNSAKAIDLTKQLGPNEEIVLEAFTSRFARASDIHLKKILRLIERIELEEKGTIIDLYNRAEQRGIIDASAQFRDMRELRNVIAHDYKENELPTFHQEIMAFVPPLLATLIPTRQYVDRLLRSLK